MKGEKGQGWCTDKGGKVLSVKIRDIFTAFSCVIHVLGQASVQCPDFCHYKAALLFIGFITA